MSDIASGLGDFLGGVGDLGAAGVGDVAGGALDATGGALESTGGFLGDSFSAAGDVGGGFGSFLGGSTVSALDSISPIDQAGIDVFSGANPFGGIDAGPGSAGGLFGANAFDPGPNGSLGLPGGVSSDMFGGANAFDNVAGTSPLFAQTNIPAFTTPSGQSLFGGNALAPDTGGGFNPTGTFTPQQWAQTTPIGPPSNPYGLGPGVVPYGAQNPYAPGFGGGPGISSPVGPNGYGGATTFFPPGNGVPGGIGYGPTYARPLNPGGQLLGGVGALVGGGLAQYQASTTAAATAAANARQQQQMMQYLLIGGLALGALMIFSNMGGKK